MSGWLRRWRAARFQTKLGLSLLTLIVMQVVIEIGADRKFSGELIHLHARNRVTESQTAFRAAEALLFDNAKLRIQEVTREPRFKAVVKLGDSATLEAQLRELAAEQRASVAAYLRLDGTAVASVSRPATVPARNFQDAAERLMSEALTGTPAAGWLLWADRPVIAVVVPVEVDGRPSGVLALGLELADATLANLRDLAGADLVIFTPQRILRQTLPLSAGAEERLRLREGQAGTAGGGSGLVELDGRSYFLPPHPVPLGAAEAGLFLTMLLPADEYLASSQSLVTEGVARNAVTVLIVVMLMALLVARATRPIRHLQTGVERLSSGDLSHRVPVESEDELGRLAETFNAMAGRIAERTAEIEQALATLDGIQDAALIFDAETLVLSYANQGACAQLGYTREELLGRRVAELLDPAQEGALPELLTAARAQAPSSVQRVMQHRRRDGRLVPVEIGLQFVSGAGRRPVFISVARDITERKALEARNLRDQRLEAIGSMAGGIAHDLNNALAPITMSVDLLRAKYPADAELVDILDQASRRGEGMVRQLLAFARGNEGERRALQPRRLVEELAQMIRGTFPKNIRLEVAMAPDLWEVNGDGTQLHQVLLNLAVNSRDAMPDGGTLRIEAANIVVEPGLTGCVTPPSPGPHVRWVVGDSGTGIPPEVRERIFDPFFTTKEPGRGTGLGLASVLRIVRSHGGFLRVDSEMGRGSAFEVYLPAQAPAGARPSAVAPKAGPWRGQGETILVVDDEESIREITRVVLTSVGFRVVLATDGADALAKLPAHSAQIRVVITDLDMPRMGGRQLIDLLVDLVPAARIVVASGTLGVSEEDRMRFDPRISTVLQKPFSQADLLRAVRTALEPAQPPAR